MVERIAWLGMYDHPGQRAANDRWWLAIAEGLRAQGIRTPMRLARHLTPDQAWSHPGLLFAQICTRPLALHHVGLRVLAHPAYRGATAPGLHRSRIVVRADDPATTLADLRGRRAAINDAGSNTGMALLRDAVGETGFFDDVIATGSHRDSARAVAAGQADVAALDEVSAAGFERFEPGSLAALRTIAWSAPVATPAFVAGQGVPIAEVAALRIALEAAMVDPGLADVRDVLGIEALVPPSPGLVERIVAAERATTVRLV